MKMSAKNVNTFLIVITEFHQARLSGASVQFNDTTRRHLTLANVTTAKRGIAEFREERFVAVKLKS